MSRDSQPNRQRKVPVPALLGAAAAVVMALGAPGNAFAEQGSPSCADCHDTAEALQHSVHGDAGLECANCHIDTAEATEFPHATPAPVDCTSCHDVKVSHNHPPRCADCHGNHGIERTGHDDHGRTGVHLSQFCGNCHEEIVAGFFEGIHGRELKKGNPDVPTCFTCHGGHGIILNEEPDSPVGSGHLAQTCARCHDDAEVEAKYGLPPGRLQTFVGTYHGLANAYGDRSVANCSSCHGAHRILPSSDPTSTISAKNLQATCGQCHPNAGRNFSRGKVHLLDRWEDNPITYVARRFYQWMIGGMMATFAVFMAVDYRYRRRLQRGHPAASRSREGGEA